MKRLILLMLVCTALLAGCAPKDDAADKPDMYVEPAQLTAREAEVQALASQGRSSILFDFRLGKEPQSLSVQVYRLEDQQWMLYTGGSQSRLPAQDGAGCFALGYGPLTEGIVTSTLDENGGVASLRQAPAEILYDVAGLNVSTTLLTNLAEVRYGEETPLLLQIITSQPWEDEPQEIVTLRPEELAALGHEHVFLVTAAFAPLSDK